MTSDAVRGAVLPHEQDWRRFRAVSWMVNHWDRPEWTPGRTAHYWYLTFQSQRLMELAAQCQAVLRLPYLDPVPLDRLHMTLPKVGWSDDVAAEELDEVAARARALCVDLPAFVLTVGPLSGSPGAVRFSVSPWEPILKLHRRLADVVMAVRGQALGEADFRPHIGVAYCNQVMPADDLIAKVGRLRLLPPVEVTITQVDLVALRRQARSYAWTTLHSLPLGPTGQL